MERLIAFDRTVIANVRGKEIVYNVELYSSNKSQRDAFFEGLTDFMNKEFKEAFTVDQVRLRWKRIRDDYSKGLKKLKDCKQLKGRLALIREACYDFLEKHLNGKNQQGSVANDQAACANPNKENHAPPQSSTRSSIFANSDRSRSPLSCLPQNTARAEDGMFENPVKQQHQPAVIHRSSANLPQDEGTSTSQQQNQQQQTADNHRSPACIAQEEGTSASQRQNQQQQINPVSPTVQQQAMMNTSENQNQQQQQPERQPLSSMQSASPHPSQVGTSVINAGASTSYQLPDFFMPPINSPHVPFTFSNLREKSHAFKTFSDDDVDMSISEKSESNSSSSDSEYSEDSNKKTRKEKYQKKPTRTKRNEQLKDRHELGHILKQMGDCIEKNKSHDRIRSRAKMLCKFLDDLNPRKQIKAMRVLMDVFKKYELKKKETMTLQWQIQHEHDFYLSK